MAKIARVFPRRTKMTPTDQLSFFGSPPFYIFEEMDEVHVSVTFSWDIDKGWKLFSEWEKRFLNTKIGGPAFADKGDEFIPGQYLQPGCVITSRGCPNKCWFCHVWKREGNIRELEITQGWNLLDSNLLACSDEHIKQVFKMLMKNDCPVHLTGGLEAARLKDWHISLLWDLRPSQIFFAYDTSDDLEPLVETGKKLGYANFTRHHLRCYVLIGGPDDSFDSARQRLMEAWTAGFMPMAMLYRDIENNVPNPEWQKFQRTWARPAIIKSQIKKEYNEAISI